MSDWRENGSIERAEFLQWAAEATTQRQGPGSDSQRKYGDLFRGEPLDQLEEEILDALFYVYFAKRKERTLTNQIELLALDSSAKGTVFFEAMQENLQRALVAEAMVRELHDAMDDMNARAGAQGGCYWCNSEGYDEHGLRHKDDCLMRRARQVVERKG